MLKTLFIAVIALVVLQTTERCDIAEWWNEGTREKEKEELKEADNTTYTDKYKCALGNEYTIQIPNRLSANCKKNWEFFARTYGCNDIGNFELANQRKRACP